jgi:hypothetical protein
MRFTRIIPLVVAAAALAVPAVSMAAPSPGGSTTCANTSLRGTIKTNITVPAGARCDLTGADVQAT